MIQIVSLRQRRANMERKGTFGVGVVREGGLTKGLAVKGVVIPRDHEKVFLFEKKIKTNKE